jgi:hypothetical protein
LQVPCFGARGCLWTPSMITKSAPGTHRVHIRISRGARSERSTAPAAQVVRFPASADGVPRVAHGQSSREPVIPCRAGPSAPRTARPRRARRGARCRASRRSVVFEIDQHGPGEPGALCEELVGQPALCPQSAQLQTQVLVIRLGPAASTHLIIVWSTFLDYKTGSLTISRLSIEVTHVERRCEPFCALAGADRVLAERRAWAAVRVATHRTGAPRRYRRGRGGIDGLA